MKLSEKVLVSGASGFIGQYIVPRMSKQYDVSTMSLRHEIDESGLNGVHAVLCLSGIAHQKKNTSPDLYFKVNRDLVIDLATKAKKNGVTQFIYLSSVKVYGDNKGEYFDLKSATIPTDPYGKSKLEAEFRLKEMEEANFSVAIIRPPLVYGPGVKGNLEQLIRLLKKLKLLPFKDISNKRSMVYVGNLYEMILKVINEKASGIFIAGDRTPHSTTELVSSMKEALNTNNKLIRLPSGIRLLLKNLKPGIYNRLFGDFVIDNQETNRILNFDPPYSLRDGVKEMILGSKRKA